MSDAFDRLIALRSVGVDAFEATIDATWTIGPKVHGGAMMSVCAAAATARVATDPDPAVLSPLAVSANYLAAPDPGEVAVTAVVRKRGRRVVVVDTTLSQNGVDAVHAVVTLGLPDAAGSRYVEPSTAASMPVEPPASAPRVGDEDSIVNVASGCEMVMANDGAGGGHGLWIRPADGDATDPSTAALFAIMAGDIGPPATMDHGIDGWAPTVQLTAYLRRIPDPGWLRVRSSSTLIGEVWFEEDHTVVDSSGAVVVQTRQLAMVPRTS